MTESISSWSGVSRGRARRCRYRRTGRVGRKAGGALAGLALAAALAVPVGAEDRADLTALSLSELANLEVTSVSKKQERLWNSTAAVHVITREDILRSGYTSIPELLRMAPGIHVAQIDAGSWAVSSRGFNGRYANKMLVLVDGRSVYTSLFSGVYWERIRVNLDDIERIEVIRGPGATIWGANAVNGVINIITREAAETQGVDVLAAGGTELRGYGQLRVGGRLGNEAFYRVSAQVSDHDRSRTELGREANDAWDFGQASWRLDWHRSPVTTLTLMGSLNRGDFSREYFFYDSPTATSAQSLHRCSVREEGWQLQARLSHVYSTTSEVTFQLYTDQYRIREPVYDTERRVYDAELQHRFNLGSRQEVVWGAGGRVYSDTIDPSFHLGFEPESETAHIVNLFAQDQVTVLDDRLEVTLGAKVEDNSHTGTEIQPSGRLLWTPRENVAAWGGVSRAVRTPSRAESSGRLVLAVIPPGVAGPGAPASAVVTVGSDAFQAEKLLAYEAGVRYMPSTQVSFDLSAYYNRYDDMRSVSWGDAVFSTAGETQYMALPLVFGNEQEAESYGAEVGLGWKPSARYAARLAYTYHRLNVVDAGSGIGGEGALWEGSSPRHSAYLRQSATPLNRVNLDAGIRFVGELTSPGVQLSTDGNVPPVDAYVALDLRAGYGVSDRVEVFAAGRNLFAGDHAEFRAELLYPQYLFLVEPDVHAGLRVRF